MSRVDRLTPSRGRTGLPRGRRVPVEVLPADGAPSAPTSRTSLTRMPVEALSPDPTFEGGPDALIRRLAGRGSYTDTAVPDDPAGEPHPLTGTGFAGTTGTASQYGNQMIRDWARSNREGNTP